MWGCVIGLQRETPPLKKKKASERAGTLTSPPASLLRSRRAPEQRPAPLPSFLSFSLRFPPPSREEKTNKEEQIAGRRSASRTFPPRIQVAASILWGVARERPRGASGAQRSGRPSWEPCRAEGGPHRQRHHHRRRRRVGWEGREPPLPPPPPGWAPFSVDAGDPGRGFQHCPWL